MRWGETPKRLSWLSFLFLHFLFSQLPPQAFKQKTIFKSSFVFAGGWFALVASFQQNTLEVKLKRDIGLSSTLALQGPNV